MVPSLLCRESFAHRTRQSFQKIINRSQICWWVLLMDDCLVYKHISISYTTNLPGRKDHLYYGALRSLENEHQVIDFSCLQTTLQRQDRERDYILNKLSLMLFLTYAIVACLYWYVYSETRPSYNSTNTVIAIPKQPIYKLCCIPFTNGTLFTYHLINKCPWPHLRVISTANVIMHYLEYKSRQLETVNAIYMYA